MLFKLAAARSTCERRELRRRFCYGARGFDVLVHVIRHRDRVVRRDGLLAAVSGGWL